MLSLLQRGLSGRRNFTNIDICSCNLWPSSHLPSLCLRSLSLWLFISAWWPLTFITPTLSLFALPLSVIIYIGLVTFDLHHIYPLSVCTPSLFDYLYRLGDLWLHHTYPLYIWALTLHYSLYLLDDLWPSSNLPSFCLRSLSLWLSISARVTLACGTGPVFFMEAISSSWSFCSSFFLSNCSCLFFSLSSWNQDNMPHL